MTENNWSTMTYCSFRYSFWNKTLSYTFSILWFDFFSSQEKMFCLFTLCPEKGDLKFKTALWNPCFMWNFSAVDSVYYVFDFSMKNSWICCAKETFQIPFYLLKKIWDSFPIFSPPGHNSFIPKVCTCVQIEWYFQHDATAVLLTVALNQFAEAVSFKLFI